MNTIRRVSTGHLVFGLIFLGITAIWVVGETSDVSSPALAVWGPIVLIAAGAVGLASTLFNSRQARVEERAEQQVTPSGNGPESPTDPTVEDTRTLGPEEQR